MSDAANERIPALLSVDDLADVLGVTRAAIYSWRYRQGGPRALRVGRQLRFRVDDVEAWLRTREDDGNGTRA